MLLLVYWELVVLAVNAIASFGGEQKVKEIREETEALYL